MNFVEGKVYQNASGRFRVVSMGAQMMKLEYATGPQAGKAMLKRIADMAKLPTNETDEPPSLAAKKSRTDRKK